MTRSPEKRLYTNIAGHDAALTQAEVDSIRQSAIADHFTEVANNFVRQFDETPNTGPYGDSVIAMVMEIKRLQAFVQYVADHCNDPTLVREAYTHGAKR